MLKINEGNLTKIETNCRDTNRKKISFGCIKQSAQGAPFYLAK